MRSNLGIGSNFLSLISSQHSSICCRGVGGLFALSGLREVLIRVRSAGVDLHLSLGSKADSGSDEELNQAYQRFGFTVLSSRVGK